MIRGERAGLVGLVGLMALVATGLLAPAAATEDACDPEGPGEIGVVVVIDYGDLPDPPDGPTVSCVPVPEGATGADVLAARAEALGTPVPRYDASGLLCAIDGLPERGCGDPVGSSYRYWSYWQGTAEGWEHASQGPAFRDADAEVVEGWRFVEGSGTPSDPPPDAPSDPADAAVALQAAQASTSGGADGGGVGSGLLGAVAGAGGVLVLVVAAVFVARRRGIT